MAAEELTEQEAEVRPKVDKMREVMVSSIMTLMMDLNTTKLLCPAGNGQRTHEAAKIRRHKVLILSSVYVQCANR